MGNEFVRRVHRKHRRQVDSRTRPDPDVPLWAAAAFADLKLGVAELARAVAVLGANAPKPPVTLAGSLLPGPLHDVVEDLFVRGKVPTLPDRSSPEYGTVAAFLQQVEARSKTLRPRKHAELEAFFRGTRMEFHALGFGDPTAKVLALLCASRGMEPIDRGMAIARKHWDERLLRWRREMDAEWPYWRSNTVAWSTTGIAA
jgi:hypothetical protein